MNFKDFCRDFCKALFGIIPNQTSQSKPNMANQHEPTQADMSLATREMRAVFDARDARCNSCLNYRQTLLDELTMFRRGKDKTLQDVNWEMDRIRAYEWHNEKASEFMDEIIEKHKARLSKWLAANQKGHGNGRG